MSVTKGKVQIFACGGCGLNIGGMLEQHRGVDEPAFAELDIAFIDTSRSNLKAHINQDHCYFIDGLDGSGKVRSENHLEIQNHIRAILQEFKPGDLNIVVSSAAGGSGSVLAPLITKELLANNAPVVVMTVGSAETRLDTENTLKTLKSFASIAEMTDAPVVMKYVQNSAEMTRKEADKHIFDAIMALAVLYSRQNHELDSKDLFNWLRFNRVTTFPVQLASLYITESDEVLKQVGNVISVATIAKEGMSTTLPQMSEYQCVGFLPENASEAVSNRMPLHYVISDGIIPDVAKELQGILSKMESAQAARGRRTNIISDKDKADGSGLVL